MSLAIQHNSLNIVRGSWDTTIKIWQYKVLGFIYSKLNAHTDSINDLVFLNNGN